MKKDFFIILVFLLASLVHARENDSLRAVGVGLSLLVAPAQLTDQNLSLGHTWEIEGFSFAATDILYRIVPKELDFLAPVLAFLGDAAYRAPELSGPNGGLAMRKFECDCLGIVGRITFSF
jgi:hypothetical protein